VTGQGKQTDPNGLDPARLRGFVDRRWDQTIVPTLTEYIRIPNKSPMFDPEWKAHGHMDRVVDLFEAWAREHAVPDMTLEVVRLEGRTPLIYIEVPGATDDTVLLYGHLDKQPEMTGWDDGKGPWTPVLENDRLYGRGGADDGYAMFASLTAIAALHDQGVPHARCVVIIEACEESGSHDLPAYIDALADRIGTPSLVICLDSGCGNYDQLWCTTSLRGIVTGNLHVELLREGIHSGDGTGIVASSFRVARALLSRLEDEGTGAIRPDALHGEIPAARRAQAQAVADALGSEVYDKFPLHDGVRPIDDDVTELVLNRTWRPALAITGAGGLPALADAGNVLRPITSLKLSLRLPPNVDADGAVGALKQLFEADPPYGARVRFDGVEGATGWDAPPVADWLEAAMHRASRAHFGADAIYMGEGGSIPFMGMLGEKFPDAQFLITGVLGPGSNAHGPNEFLDIPCGKKVTACVAEILADHHRR
jgi:acetylornithine deacetylase/succinyl-diaminopimelate desuccinylase-like protein